jgi:5-methyltetrahydropteroyltriglutamate--homocysteine methyltransferase
MTALVSRPPFRADHVGSLLRPKQLREAFRRYDSGRMAGADFAEIQERAIREVVELQTDVGLQVVTDGEFRRSSYWGRFVARCHGFSIKPAVFKFRDDDGHEVEFTATYGSGKLRRTEPLAADEFQFLSSVTKLTGKITIPAPSTMHFYRCTDFADARVYADARSFFADLARIYREEIADLAKAGCRYVQLDEVAVAMLCDPAIRAKIEASGQAPDQLVELYLSEGGYQAVAERYFKDSNVTHFLLEYDSARAGDFRPLSCVPADKGVVLGLISTKTPVLEKLDDLRRRTDEAAKFIDLDRLGISPQCGFASTAAGNPLTEADQRAKLGLVVSAARAIWG